MSWYTLRQKRKLSKETLTFAILFGGGNLKYYSSEQLALVFLKNLVQFENTAELQSRK